MRKLMLVDVDACTGCRACAVTCSMTKSGVFSPTNSRIYIREIEDKCLSIPILCQHCENPPCLETCPSGAISKDNETGVVKIHQDLCVGCEKCRFVCPFGPETIKIENGVAVKCDLCGGKPACVDVCQPGALLYVTGTQAFLYKRRELVEKLTSSISKLRE